MITINIDLSIAQEVKVLVLFDHNLSSAATITLKGVEPTLFSEAITWNDNKIIHYLSAATTKRYWQLQITDTTNSDNYIEIGELFLGTYFEPEKYWADNPTRNIKSILETNITSYGARKNIFYNKQLDFSYNFDLITDEEMNNFESMFDSIANRETGKLQPIYFTESSVSPNNTWIVELSAIPRTLAHKNKSNISLSMIEVIKSV